MRWHDSSHALLPYALPPPQEPATTQCWISTETYPVKKQARFRLLAHYACIFPSTISALSIIVHFSGIFPENYYFFRKKLKMKEKKTSMYCIYVFVSAETNEKASLQWRALLGKLYYRELLGGGGNEHFSGKNRAFRGNHRIMYKSLEILQKGIKIEFCPIRTASRPPASSQFLSVLLGYTRSTAIIFMASWHV